MEIARFNYWRSKLQKPDVSIPLIGNPPFYNYGHIASLHDERRKMRDKVNHAFLDDAPVDSRHKIGLHEWSDIPRGRTLNVVEGEDKISKEN